MHSLVGWMYNKSVPSFHHPSHQLYHQHRPSFSIHRRPIKLIGFFCLVNKLCLPRRSPGFDEFGIRLICDPAVACSRQQKTMGAMR